MLRFVHERRWLMLYLSARSTMFVSKCPKRVRCYSFIARVITAARHASVIGRIDSLKASPFLIAIRKQIQRVLLPSRIKFNAAITGRSIKLPAKEIKAKDGKKTRNER